VSVLPFRRPRVELAAALPAGRRVAIAPPRTRSGTILEVGDFSGLAGAGVARSQALTIPACAACRDLVVGTTVQLGIYRYRGPDRIEPGYLLTRPDPSTTWVATLAGTVDELAFYGRAYWRVLARDAEGVPTRARWTPVSDVAPQVRSSGGSYQELTGYRIAGVGNVPIDDVIRFDSPLPGVLATGAVTLAAGLELEAAARRLSSVELPAGVLENQGTELGDDEAADLVASFQAARRENGLAFLQGVTYKREALSPSDLQLVEARAAVATDVARLWNVPVAMIGASPSGNAAALLYSNLSQQLAVLISSAVSPHLRTVEQTLTDVIPRGQAVAFDVQTFLRSDPAAAADYALSLWQAELVTRDEARSFLGLPAYPSASADLTPGKV
jgi:phage portal protein BeeE